MCLLNFTTMLSFRVPANNMTQAMLLLVPNAMSTEVDLVPVLDMVPLDFLPPSHSPQKRTFCDFCMAKAPNPVRSKTKKQGALRKAAVKKEEINVSCSR